VVNIRGSASAFTSQSVTIFAFFYKPKNPIIPSRDKNPKVGGSLKKIWELWFPVPLVGIV
jgi:hypothetical protein